MGNIDKHVLRNYNIKGYLKRIYKKDIYIKKAGSHHENR